MVRLCIHYKEHNMNDVQIIKEKASQIIPLHQQNLKEYLTVVRSLATFPKDIILLLNPNSIEKAEI